MLCRALQIHDLLLILVIIVSYRVGIVGPMEETGKVTPQINELVRSRTISKRWAPKNVLLLHGKHSLVPPCRNSLVLGRGKDLCRSQGDLEAKRNVFFYVTTHGLMAGFPITNGFLLNSRGQSPSPFLAGTKQGLSARPAAGPTT